MEYKFIKIDDSDTFCGYIQAQDEHLHRICMIDGGQQKLGEKIAELLSAKEKEMRYFTLREREIIYFGLSRLLDDKELLQKEFDEIDNLRFKFRKKGV